MSIKDALASIPSVTEQPWTPKAVFDGCSGEVATAAYDTEVDLDDAEAIDQIIRAAGLDPARVMCTEHPRVSTWDVPGHGRQWAYKLKLAPRSKSRTDVDRIMQGIEPAEPKVRKRGSHWATVQIGDVHIGKSAEAGGGTESILQRYKAMLDNALDELHLCDPAGIEGVHVAFVGDMIEGVVSQGGRNIALMDLTLTEQITVATRLTVQTIRTFADAGYQVKVSAIGGNHGDTQRVQGQALGDNHDVGIAVAACDLLAELPQYGDVVDLVVPPRDQSYMTFPVGDSTFVAVHGHQFQGGTAHSKVERWWAGQALGGSAAANGQVLMAGHFHTFAHLNIAQGKTAVYSPSMEHLSRWYFEKCGATSDRGAAFYLTSAGRVSHMTII